MINNQQIHKRLETVRDVHMPVAFVAMHSPQMRGRGYSSGTKTWPKIHDCWVAHFLNQTSIPNLELYTLDGNMTANAEKMVADHHGEGRVQIKQIPEEDFDQPADVHMHRNHTSKNLHREEGEAAFEQPTKQYMVQFFNIILSHLERGQPVLHSDTDAMWVRDPWPVLKSILERHPDNDIVAAPGFVVGYDGPHGTPLMLDTAFMYFGATDRTVKMVRELRDKMIHTRSSDMNGEMKKINQYVFHRGFMADSNQHEDGCKFFNSKDKLFQKVNTTYIDTNHSRTQKEVTAVERKAHEEWKEQVDELGLTGICAHDMRVTFLDHRWIRPGTKEESILVHPQLSWLRYRRDIYEEFKKIAPGVCP